VNTGRNGNLVKRSEYFGQNPHKNLSRDLYESVKLLPKSFTGKDLNLQMAGSSVGVSLYKVKVTSPPHFSTSSKICPWMHGFQEIHARKSLVCKELVLQTGIGEQNKAKWYSFAFRYIWQADITPAFRRIVINLANRVACERGIWRFSQRKESKCDPDCINRAVSGQGAMCPVVLQYVNRNLFTRRTDSIKIRFEKIDST